MIADPTAVVLTAHVAARMDADPVRHVWILARLRRHNAGDWGELDPHDLVANDHALAQRDGRVLSSYPVTDDLTDPLTTILWPADY